METREEETEDKGCPSANTKTEYIIAHCAIPRDALPQTARLLPGTQIPTPESTPCIPQPPSASLRPRRCVPCRGTNPETMTMLLQAMQYGACQCDTSRRGRPRRNTLTWNMFVKSSASTDVDHLDALRWVTGVATAVDSHLQRTQKIIDGDNHGRMGDYRRAMRGLDAQ